MQEHPEAPHPQAPVPPEPHSPGAASRRHGQPCSPSEPPLPQAPHPRSSPRQLRIFPALFLPHGCYRDVRPPRRDAASFGSAASPAASCRQPRTGPEDAILGRARRRWGLPALQDSEAWEGPRVRRGEGEEESGISEPRSPAPPPVTTPSMHPHSTLLLSIPWAGGARSRAAFEARRETPRLSGGVGGTESPELEMRGHACGIHPGPQAASSPTTPELGCGPPQRPLQPWRALPAFARVTPQDRGAKSCLLHRSRCPQVEGGCCLSPARAMCANVLATSPRQG